MGRGGADGGGKRAGGQKGFYGSGVQMGYGVALVLVTGIMLVLSKSLDNAPFLSWGWRLPFLFSIVLVGSPCGSGCTWTKPPSSFRKSRPARRAPVSRCR